MKMGNGDWGWVGLGRYDKKGEVDWGKGGDSLGKVEVRRGGIGKV